MNLSIIIPVYNEAGNVSNLYQEIVSALSDTQYEYEVIFVDDGSNDGTRELLRQMEHSHANLRLIAHARNYGQSAALVSGARAARYEWLVSLDGDGQNDPRDIPNLVAKLAQTSDKIIVAGTRTKRDDSTIRKISSKIAKGALKLLHNDSCEDTGCSLKLFPKQIFLTLPHFNHLHRFIPILFKRAGYKTVNVAVNHRPRLHGTSKYGVMNRLWVGITDVFGVLWLVKRPCNPEIAHE